MEVNGDPMAEKLAGCIAALGQTDPQDDRTSFTTYHKRTEGTCQWILENGVFQRWKSEEDSEQPLIWICDRPGVGKTTLAIFISEHLEQSNPTNDNSWVLYYFCDRQDENRNTAASILKSFMFQLYNKQHGLAEIIYNEYLVQREALFQRHSIEALWRLFRAMVNACPVRRIFCIIDGLDQCHEPTLDHFLKKLNDFFTRHNQRQALKNAETLQNGSSDSSSQVELLPLRFPDLRMIILSREDPSCVVKELSPFPRLGLRSDGAQTGESDLKRVINANIDKVSASFSRNKGPSKETTEVVTKALRDGEDRSFLWVTLAAEKLMGMKQTQVKEYVTQMPESVEGLHIQRLLEVPSRQRPHVSAILKWVALAVRPLSILELTKAVKYSLKTSFSTKTLRKALGVCNGLVQAQGKLVILAHQSVQELLFREPSPLKQNEELKDFVFERSDAHSELANTCVSYLQQSANLEKSRRVRLKPTDKLNREDTAFLRKHPFLEYAIVHWTFHAKQGNLDKTDYSVSFFKDDSARRRLWWESHWISRRQTFAWKWTAPGGFSLLHLAAFFDIVPLALYVDERKGRIQELLGAEDHQGMKPINWATERSQAAMVKFLLQRGEFDEEALRQAARTGEASIITMLLENRDKMLRTPKIPSAKTSPAAPFSPIQSFRKVTLSSISDWSKKFDDTKDETSTPLSPEVIGYGKATSETPLHIAATCGKDEAIKAFLNVGEDLHKTTDGGWTALHNAAWFGRVSIVNLLVTAGADANAGTKEQLTPLHCAVKNSQPAVVEWLLSKRVVDIEAEDQFGLTPFHVACKSNDIPIMEILLDYGASIERKMRQGWTPLLWACINGQFAVAEFLLKRGADISAKWVQVYTEAGKAIELGPVGLAKAYRHEGIARLVERFGAIDANRLSGDEAKALPPAQTAKEDYDVPEVQDVVFVEREGTETDGILDVGHSESSAESDGESDDSSEVSEGGSRSRKQSAVNTQENGRKRRQSSLALRGLGIHEEVGGDVKVEAVQDDKKKERKPCADAARENIRATSQDPTGFDIQGQSHGEADSESQDPFEGIGRKLSTTGIGEEALNKSADDLPADRRSSSVSKSPGLLGYRFGRFVPKRGVNRTGSTASEEKPAPLEATEEAPQIAAESSDAVGGEADNLVVDPAKADVGMLGRFGSRRIFSWKNEGDDEVKKTPSPRIEEISDQLSAQGGTAEASNKPSLPDSNELQSLIDDNSRSNSASLPAPDQTSNPSRFHAKRVFSWRTAPGDKDASTATPQVAPGPVVEGNEQAPAQGLDLSDEELGKADNGEPTVGGTSTTSSPNALGDQASKGGRTFPGKMAFGWKKTSES